MSKEKVIEAGEGWQLYAHPVFIESLEDLLQQVETAKKREPGNYKSSEQYKKLKQLFDLIYKDIPSNPNARKYYLKKDLKQLRRAKFRGRYRLFYMFLSAKTLICYLWFNDESTLRKSGSTNDPYNIIRQILGLKKKDPVEKVSEKKQPFLKYNLP